MKKFFSSRKGRTALIAVAAVLTIAVAAMIGFLLWRDWFDRQVWVRDVTVELGTERISLSDFLMPQADEKNAGFVSGAPSLDRAGEQEITLRYGRTVQKATLSVVDTTPPRVTFQNVTLPIDEMPKAEDFVAQVEDLQNVRICFAQDPGLPETYQDRLVEVVVSDESGNSVSCLCTLSYVWLPESVDLELGQTLTAASFFSDPKKDGKLLSQSELDRINSSPVGDYVITSVLGNRVCSCKVSVRDTTAPELEVQDVSASAWETVELEDFVVSVTDVSGQAECQLVTEIDYDIIGEQTVTIRAVDANGNETTKQAKLVLKSDVTAPYISGLDELFIQKGGEADYGKGVNAWDDKDGTVSFSYDASTVNVDLPGTYYVVYSSTDKAGNLRTSKRKVTVLPSQEDVQKMVAEIAATLPNDPQALLDYVRGITYSNADDWGGESPIWYGFQMRRGNCYVHAECYRALLREKGYTSQLIWATDKSHYWVLVQINGVWRHSDPTPLAHHMVCSFMTDEDRYANLQGRDWDRSAWPAAE